jgi:hypothetical protein
VFRNVIGVLILEGGVWTVFDVERACFLYLIRRSCIGGSRVSCIYGED